MSEVNKREYTRFVEMVNAQDFEALDRGRRSPECYTRDLRRASRPGWVNLEDALDSLQTDPLGYPGPERPHR